MAEINRGMILGVAAGAALAFGQSPAGAEAANLTDATPTLASSLDRANQQLDFVLDAEGPNGCLAVELGNGLGIKSSNERAQYITSGGIDLIKKQVATRADYPTELGCDIELPAKTSNAHLKSAAFVIAASEIPAHSVKSTKKTKKGYELRHAAMSQADGNILTDSLKPAKKHIDNAVNIDVSYGVDQAVDQYARDENDTLTGCSQAMASKAIAGAVTQIHAEEFIVKNKKITFSQFQTIFNKDVSDAKSAIKNAADLAANKTDCAPTGTISPVVPPTESAPPLASPIPAPAPQPTPPTPEQDPYASGNVGVDISWPNCGAAVPEGTQFGIVGVTDGLGYSTSPCLAEEAANFTDEELSFYANTGWNSESSHVDPNSPNVCATGDEDCLAYNYGYNAGLYAVDAVVSAGLNVHRGWWLDVEDDATWADDTEQNRNSILGEHDALIASGATSVGAYSTTALWDSITASWQNNWPSWGATTWETAKDAMTYCTGHEFTGGPSKVMQFKASTESNNLDQDVVC